MAVELTPALSRRLGDYVQGLDPDARLEFYAALKDAETEADVERLAGQEEDAQAGRPKRRQG